MSHFVECAGLQSQITIVAITIITSKCVVKVQQLRQGAANAKHSPHRWEETQSHFLRLPTCHHIPQRGAATRVHAGAVSGGSHVYDY
jgi:hypothetical protein